MELATINLDPDARCKHCLAVIEVEAVCIEDNYGDLYCTRSCFAECERQANEDAYDEEQSHPRHGGGAVDCAEERAAWMRLK